MDISREFVKDWPSTARRNHRCAVCGERITAGNKCIVEQWSDRKYYPVKGSTNYTHYLFRHPDCKRATR